MILKLTIEKSTASFYFGMVFVSKTYKNLMSAILAKLWIIMFAEKV
jgi:hypothetical protein